MLKFTKNKIIKSELAENNMFYQTMKIVDAIISIINKNKTFSKRRSDFKS